MAPDSENYPSFHYLTSQDLLLCGLVEICAAATVYELLIEAAIHGNAFAEFVRAVLCHITSCCVLFVWYQKCS